MRLFLLGVFLNMGQWCSAEIVLYKSTENTGINKLEQIGVIEQYLINLSSTLQTIEGKVDTMAQKVTSLEKAVTQIKESDLKNIENKLSEKASPAKTLEMEELNKLQADFRSIKNEDIELLRLQIQGLNSSVSRLQSQSK